MQPCNAPFLSYFRLFAILLAFGFGNRSAVFLAVFLSLILQVNLSFSMSSRIHYP